MDFENYYNQQARNKVPSFIGASYQRGYGFADVFKNFLIGLSLY